MKRLSISNFSHRILCVLPSVFHLIMALSVVMKKITQTLTLRLRRVNPQPPTPSVVAFPRTERSHFYCCKVSLLAEKDFCVAHTANDTDQRPGHSICHSVQGRGGGRVLTRVCVGWVCVLAVRQYQTLTSAAGRALNTRHFCCM